MEQRYYKDGIEVTVGQQPPRPPYMYSSQGGNPQPPKKSHKGLIIFLIILALIVALCAGCVAFTKKVSSNFSLRFFGGGEEEEFLPDEDYIATMYVEGEISDSGSTSYFGSTEGYDHRWTLDKLDSLMEDDNNKGLIVFLNTPGGGVYESDELYLKLKEYQSETGRPFYAVMGDMCASGGVYATASADKIYANRNSWTGSIGVTLGTLIDVSELLERYGVKTTTISSAKNKNMGSMYEELTDEQKKILQALVDEPYDQFVSVISEGRNMDLARAYEISDGRIYSAKQAKELGLIDEIGTLEDAIEAMKKDEKFDCEAYDITPDTSPNYFNEFFNFASNLKNAGSVSDIQAVENIMKMAEKPLKPMYLMQ